MLKSKFKLIIFCSAVLASNCYGMQESTKWQGDSILEQILIIADKIEILQEETNKEISELENIKVNINNEILQTADDNPKKTLLFNLLNELQEQISSVKAANKAVINSWKTHIENLLYDDQPADDEPIDNNLLHPEDNEAEIKLGKKRSRSSF